MQEKPIRTYKADEVEAMIEAAQSAWWRALIRMAFTTGLRRGELINLLWTDIDGEAGTVTINAKRAGTVEVDGEELPVLAWEAKTREPRTVPIPQVTIDALDELHDPLDESPYIFMSSDRLRAIATKLKSNGGTLPPSYHLVPNIRRDLRRIQRAAMLLGKLRTFHDFRRSYGTMLATRVPLHDLRRLMGHSTIRTTERYYLAPTLDLADRVREAFAAES